MNVLLFVIIIAVIFFVVFYYFMLKSKKKVFGKKVFWTMGVASVLYAMIFNGLIDRIFIVVFAFFLVFAKTLFRVMDT